VQRIARLTSVAVAVAGVASLAAAGADSAGADRQPTVEEVVQRAGEYVGRFVDAFSNVIMEEHYVQSISAGVPSGLIRGGGQRDLKADLLLVRVGGEFAWRPFRDVFEVAGRPVRDREERLTKLFLGPRVLALEQAERIAQESSRYNIGAVIRTINTPVHTLLFLQPMLRIRFRFTLEGRDPDAGPNVWTVKYEERARPTLIRGDRDADLPVSGHFWIDLETGQVLRSELVAYTGAGSARLTTRFRVDVVEGIAVPVEMTEEYQLQRSRVTATATYSRIRHFGVSTTTDVAPARP
jgi:hypothetical protein